MSGCWSVVRCAIVSHALIATAACSSSGSSNAAEPSPTPTTPAVRLATAIVTSIHPSLTLPGTIAPAEVVALSNSIVEPALTVNVQEGDRITRGELLAQLDVDDLQANLVAAVRNADADAARTSQTTFSAQLAFAQGPTQVRQARAQLVQAQQTAREAALNLRRDEQLVAQGYLPRQNYDEQQVVVGNDRQAIAAAGATLQSAIANQTANGTAQSGLEAATITQAREQAASARATAEQLRRQIARAHIVSPVDGVVVNRNLNPGEYPSGRQIFTLESNATVFAILTASAVQAYQIRPGDRVGLARAGMPSGRFTGTVAAVLDAATAGSTNFTVKVRVPNPRAELRAGTPVSATVALAAVRGIAVPASAFVNDARTRVIVVAAGRARSIPVRELATDGANSIVSGLRAGQRIARDGSSGIADGQRVEAIR